MAGATLAFARAMGEFGATIMVAGNRPGKTNTMPMTIYSETLYGSAERGSVDGAPVRGRRGGRHVRLQPAGTQGGEDVKSVPRLEVRLFKEVEGFTLDASWHMGNELAVLFGYSGSGKSMTLRMIAGLAKPDSGSVVLDGEVLLDSDTRRCVPPQGRQFGYVGQDLALFPHMSVASNIAYGLKGLSKEEQCDRVQDLLALFHLEGLGNKEAAGDLGWATAAGGSGSGPRPASTRPPARRAVFCARPAAQVRAVGGGQGSARTVPHPHPACDSRSVRCPHDGRPHHRLSPGADLAERRSARGALQARFAGDRHVAHRMEESGERGTV